MVAHLGVFRAQRRIRRRRTGRGVWRCPPSDRASALLASDSLRRWRPAPSPRLALAWPSASAWLVASAWPWARSLPPFGPESARATRRVSGPTTGNRLPDRCLHRPVDRRTRRLGGRDLRRHEHDAEIGRLDPSLPPREAEARKPKPWPPKVRLSSHVWISSESNSAYVNRLRSGLMRWLSAFRSNGWNSNVIHRRCLGSAAGAGRNAIIYCAHVDLTGPPVMALPKHLGVARESHPVHCHMHTHQTWGRFSHVRTNHRRGGADGR